ncbi:MAG: Npun_F5749 family FMN-dependent PPOX-type flavoprotein [Cyanobacteria bacterium J06554_3]
MSIEFDANFEIAPWRSPLARALHRNRSQPFCRFLQLATVRAEGTPANRTVVFRGFLDGSDRLMMISDRRSQKTAQIQQNPNAEACWYFTKTREQFRLSGELTLVTAETTDPAFSAARQQVWQKISDNARLQFAWSHPKELRTEASNFEPPAPEANSPLSTFCLLLLKPHTVDYLSLRGEPQTRLVYQQKDHSAQERSAEWSFVEVNP